MNAIYLWRIIYTFMIMVYHFDTHFFVRAIACKGGVFGWYIAVDFFFIVSGFLLFKKAEESGDKLSAVGYTWNRIKKIYPSYLLAFILTYLVIVQYTEWMHDEYIAFRAIDGIIDNILEALMLQGIFTNSGPYVNYTAWYISVLIVAGYFIYFFLSKKKELFLYFLGPVMILFGYGYLYKQIGNLDVTTATPGIVFLTPAMLRGFAGMSLGVYANLFSKMIREFLERRGTCSRICIRALSVLCLAGVAVLSLRYGETTYDFFYVILLFLGVSIAFVPYRRELKPSIKKILIFTSNLTLNMYLIHNVFREWIFPHIYKHAEVLTDIDKILIMLVYFATVIVASVLMDIVLKGIRNLFTKKGMTK